MVLSIYPPIDLIYVFKHMWRGEKKACVLWSSYRSLMSNRQFFTFCPWLLISSKKGRSKIIDRVSHPAKLRTTNAFLDLFSDRLEASTITFVCSPMRVICVPISPSPYHILDVSRQGMTVIVLFLAFQYRAWSLCLCISWKLSAEFTS